MGISPAVHHYDLYSMHITITSMEGFALLIDVENILGYEAYDLPIIELYGGSRIILKKAPYEDTAIYAQESPEQIEALIMAEKG